MPQGVVQSLRREAENCLRVAQGTRDPRLKGELVAAAAWLHEEAVRLEKLLGGGGGPDSGSPPGSRRRRASFTPHPPPRYQSPAAPAAPV